MSEIREGRARPSYGSKKRWGWGFDGQNFKQETSATKWIINTNVKFSEKPKDRNKNMIKHLEAKDVCKHIPKNTTKVNSPLSNRLVLTYTRHKLTSDEINTHVLNK